MLKFSPSQVLITTLLVILVTSCHVGRYFVWNVVDLRDHKKFPALTVTRDSDQPFLFAKSLQPELFESIPYRNGKHKMDSLVGRKKDKTVALVIVRNDTILFEEYYGKYEQSSVVPSFSVAKSFTSALIGIAIEEGAIESVSDPVSKYLPELCDSDPRIEELTIGHLLDMFSGLDFNERAFFNPFKGIAPLYYGKNLERLVSKLEFERDPGTRYEYQSVNTQVLGLILERATGKTPAEYLQEKIWKKIGMEYDASWSIDSKKNRTVKTYCCLNATARDFAKFGRLYLNHGQWNGEQIVPKEWVQKSITSTPPYRRYQNHWYSVSRPVYFDSLELQTARQHYRWLRRSRRYPDKYFAQEMGPAFMASGLLGQFIYVDPRKNLVMVRLGKGYGDVDWWQFFERVGEVL